MSVDIEKICRTCLALSGPLLSIFDGAPKSGGDSGCVADMLRGFTKIKPKPSDNLPEKVCLSCISEINRCYSFKMKCENANKTLHQLLYETVGELEDEEGEPEHTKPKVVQSDKEVQTALIEQESLVEQTHKSVQTEEPISSQGFSERFSEKELTKVLKQELGSSQQESLEMNPLDCDVKISHPRRVNIKEIKLKQTEFNDDQYRNDDDIIFELQTESGQDGNEAENQSEVGEIEASTAYYVLSESQENDEDKPNACYDSEPDIQMSNNEDEEPSQNHDYNFTIIQTEEGKEEITATAPKHLVKQKARNPLKRTNQERTKYKCPACPFTFSLLNNLKRHCIRIHDWSPIELGRLHGEELTLPDDMQETILQELEDEIIFEREEREIQNKLEENTDISKASLTAPSAPTVFCPRCNAGFAFRKSLNYHLKQNQCTVQTYECSDCQRVFTTAEGLEEHQESHLLDHVCGECKSVFEDKEELSKHLIEVHNRSKRNQCNVCKQVFTMVSALKDHLRIHSGEKPFLCQTCGKAFRQNANLKQHVMRHSNIKPYECDECSVRFVSKAELMSHKRRHTGDHPFKCDFCDARYTTSSSLVKHKRKHTGERPYACEYCPMRFTALNVLKNHRRTHTGEKPFHCFFCNKGFTQKSDCQIHQRTHTGEKRYTCHCGASFTHLSSLRMHQKTHDNEKDGDTGSANANGIKKRKKLRSEETTQSKKVNIKKPYKTCDDASQADDDTVAIVNAAGPEEEFMDLAMDKEEMNDIC